MEVAGILATSNVAVA